MLKEKYENVKTFVKEHKTEIILGAVSIGTITVLGTKYNKIAKDNLKLVKDFNDLKTQFDWRGVVITDLEIGMENMYQMFSRSLSREECRIVFEMKALQEYIDNLDKGIKINQIVNIPNAKERMNELSMQLTDILKDSDKAKEIMKYILH